MISKTLHPISAMSIVLAVALLAGCGNSTEPEPMASAAGSDASDGMLTTATPVAAPVAAAVVETSPAFPADGIPTFSTEHLASKGFFYAGGEYVGDPPIMGGHMYVEVWEPREATQPYPLVMFHGNGQTG